MSRSGLIITVVCSLPMATFAAGPNIELAIVDNQIVTTHFFGSPNASYALAGVTYVGENYNPLYLGENQRVFNVPLVENTSGASTLGVLDNGWYGQSDDDDSAPFTGPGIAYGANADSLGNAAESGFAPGNLIAEYLIGSLREWNGSGFAPSGADRLEGVAGPLDDADSVFIFTDPAGTETGSWGVTPSVITPDSHSQVEWRLDSINSEVPDPTPADGIYLAELQVWTAQRVDGLAVAPSLPFYFVFDKNDDAQLDAADAYVQNILAPEPMGMGCLGLGCFFTLRRRKRGMALECSC